MRGTLRAALRAAPLRRAAWFAGLAWTSALAAACNAGDDPPTASPEDDAGSCVDSDGDGFGLGCAAGPDCDDADPKVHSECSNCAKAGTPGCVCTGEGDTLDCGYVVEKFPGFTLCGEGIVTCTKGTWSKCGVDRRVKAPEAGPTRDELADAGVE